MEMIALLLIKPGPLRDGIDALLVSRAGEHLVAHSSYTGAALDFCRHNAAELIIIEVRPEDRLILDIVCDMKALCPQGKVLALIHDENDRKPAEQALVDLALSVGTPAPRLKASIEELVISSAGGGS